MPEAPKKPKRVEIYGLIDPRDGALRYIGKANCAKKRLKSHLRDAQTRKTPVYSWIRALASSGLRPHVRVLRECSNSDWASVEREEIATARKRGERLLNLAEGGDEPYCSPAVRAMNGRASAMRATPQSILRSMQIIGRGARDADAEGDVERARHFRETIRLIRKAVTECRQNGNLDLLAERFAQSRAQSQSSAKRSPSASLSA